MNDKYWSVSSKARDIVDEIEELRIQYIEEKQSHANTRRLLNYVMRELKEFKIPKDFHLDFTLLTNAVMFKDDLEDEYTLLYSLDELEKGIETFKESNPYPKMKETLDKYKKIYKEEK